jgi:putative ABC transport system permease protein
MLRHALAEVRFHPGRFVSTILAVAISVGFLAGSAVFVATEGRAQGRAANVAIAAADIVVSTPADGADIEGATAAIAGTPGVTAVAPVVSLQEVVSTGSGAELLQLVRVPPEPLRWAELASGRWPSGAQEVALSAGAASALGVAAGGTLQLAGSDAVLTVVGVTDEPSTRLAKTGYAADAAFTAAGLDLDGGTQWAVKVASDADPATVLTGLRTALASSNPGLVVGLGEQVREQAIAEVARNFDAFTTVLWAFAAVALVVGMITISNTFSITLAQRRRQIGLLRAVGASGGQVRGRFLVEAALLGLLGSGIGIAFGIGAAAAASTWTGSVFWGLSVPATPTVVAFGLGVVATTVAAWVPIVRGTRVAPLEALQPVPPAGSARRAWLLRTIACGLLLLAGGGLAVVALNLATPEGFLVAIGAGALIALGVLFGAPLFVPVLLRASGRLLRGAGTVPRLAADNAERNPRRAATTATALMLAIGLVVTLQVATASIRATVLDQIRQRYPVDVSIAMADAEGGPRSLPAELRTRLAGTPGVAGAVSLTVAPGTLGEGEQVTLISYNSEFRTLSGVVDEPDEDEVLVNPDVAKRLGATVRVHGGRNDTELRVVGSDLADFGEAIVPSRVFAWMAKPVKDARLWLVVPDRSRAVEVITAVTSAAGPGATIGGGLAMAAGYEQVLDLLLTITTALLAIAVVIALIGVSNTLGLSVLERTRESALLRALGLQARSLRAMLTLEALQVTMVGVVVGIVAGAFFGWLAVASLATSVGFPRLVFTVDVPQTAAMVGIAVVAAALASVLPGRRAARAVPTEALADL